MDILAYAISLPTLLILISPDLPALSMILTGAFMLVTFAWLCFAFARTNDLPGGLWFLGGLLFGAPALAVLCLRIDRDAQR